jgi:branched-chain amino acid transport system permease protein
VLGIIVALPFISSGYLLNLLTLIAVQALPALGLALLMGFTGQISLGHAAFYGLGAYGSALLSRSTGMSPWFSTPIAVLATGVVAYGIGRPIFRLQGHLLAMVTLGLGIIVSIGLVEMRGLTGGAIGLPDIPPYVLFGHAFTDAASFAVLAWIVCGLALALVWNLVDSPAGLAMRGLGESERGALSLGVDVTRLKCQVLALSAMFAALGGALYAHDIGFISPQPFGVGFSVRLLVMIAIGGFRSVTGVLAGTAVTIGLQEPLQDLGNYDVIVFGMLLTATVILFPEGLLVGLLRLSPL